ncbi:ABC transporter ATP-binding protein [Corynebacterium diphtheriae]|nr:ABC transporter ATP-binding protein [Corynebacterium diphtheriae]CAB0526064.1 ABC transporter ATP-binding protein [Corynebacterium diphtheriae]CAB0911702.1 ABC transporter ATP-binding protein [Corynebacterium diphtheriae]CAB0962836.1 ABC transporter ATP-binding protein [Corynebacterium diphtheriae]
MISASDVVVDRCGRLVVHGVTLRVGAGEIVGIVGPNGCGKSTLLQAIHGALKLAGGKVIVDGNDIHQLRVKDIAKQIAVVAQERDQALPLTVRDAVGLGALAYRRLLDFNADANEAIVSKALEQVSLTSLQHRLITELSGGERQRALIARAIVQQADHLLLDEPTNHLDLAHQFELMELVRDLRCATIVVLHDLNLAARYCDRVVVLSSDGHVVAAGEPADAFTSEMITDVFGVAVERVVVGGRMHLVFDSLTIL